METENVCPSPPSSSQQRHPIQPVISVSPTPTNVSSSHPTFPQTPIFSLPMNTTPNSCFFPQPPQHSHIPPLAVGFATGSQIPASSTLIPNMQIAQPPPPFTAITPNAETEVLHLDNICIPEFADSLKLSLAGKLLTHRSINKRAFKFSMPRIWGIQNNSVEITEVADDIFLFKFKSESDKRRVNSGGPWNFDAAHIVLEEIDPEVPFAKMSFSSSIFWARALDLPPWCFTLEAAHKVAKIIGDKMGGFVSVDDGRLSNNSIHRFLRFRFIKDLKQPLARYVPMSFDRMTITNIRLQYERLPDFCHMCGILGHVHSVCSLPATGNPSSLPFGDWLKADRSNPAHKRTDSKFQRRDESKNSESLNHSGVGVESSSNSGQSLLNSQSQGQLGVHAAVFSNVSSGQVQNGSMLGSTNQAGRNRDYVNVALEVPNPNGGGSTFKSVPMTLSSLNQQQVSNVNQLPFSSPPRNPPNPNHANHLFPPGFGNQLSQQISPLASPINFNPSPSPLTPTQQFSNPLFTTNNPLFHHEPSTPIFSNQSGDITPTSTEFVFRIQGKEPGRTNARTNCISTVGSTSKRKPRVQRVGSNDSSGDRGRKNQRRTGITIGSPIRDVSVHLEEPSGGEIAAGSGEDPPILQGGSGMTMGLVDNISTTAVESPGKEIPQQP